MTEPQGPANQLWQSLKQSLSFGKSQDLDDPKGDIKKPPGSVSRLPAPDVDSLPPLQDQNGSNPSHLQRPEERHSKNHQRSSSWLKRISSLQRSSEHARSGPDSAKLATAEQSQPQLSSTGSGIVESAGLAQNGSARPQALQEQSSLGTEAAGEAQSGTREAFLQEYDKATLELCNRLSGSTASCMADTGFQEVAPWNREPGHLVNFVGLPEDFPFDSIGEVDKLFPIEPLKFVILLIDCIS